MTIDDDDLDEYSRRRFPQNNRVEPDEREIMNVIGRYFVDNLNANGHYPPRQLRIGMDLEEELENRFERLARRERNQPNMFSNVGIILLVTLFFVSSVIRYFLEVCSNAVVASFREKIDWQFYLKESVCDGEEGLKKVVCKAYKMCLQEVIP